MQERQCIDQVRFLAAGIRPAFDCKTIEPEDRSQWCAHCLESVPYVEVDTETAYGSSVRLSWSIRVF